MNTTITPDELSTSERIHNIIKDISGKNTVLSSEMIDALLDLLNHVEIVTDEFCELVDEKIELTRQIDFYETTYGKADIPVDFLPSYMTAILTPEGVEKAKEARRKRAGVS